MSKPDAREQAILDGMMMKLLRHENEALKARLSKVEKAPRPRHSPSQGAAMTDLRERLAGALFKAVCPHLDWDEYSREFGIRERYLACIDAVLLIARPAIIEECAGVADSFDWYSAGMPSETKAEDVEALSYAIATAIRKLAEKP